VHQIVHLPRDSSYIVFIHLNLTFDHPDVLLHEDVGKNLNTVKWLAWKPLNAKNILTLTVSQLNRQIYHCKMDLSVNQTGMLVSRIQVRCLTGKVTFTVHST
jgi:hypothetical protein